MRGGKMLQLIGLVVSALDDDVKYLKVVFCHPVDFDKSRINIDTVYLKVKLILFGLLLFFDRNEEILGQVIL